MEWYYASRGFVSISWASCWPFEWLCLQPKICSNETKKNRRTLKDLWEPYEYVTNASIPVQRIHVIRRRNEKRLLCVHAELMKLPTDAFYWFCPVVRYQDLELLGDCDGAFYTLYATFPYTSVLDYNTTDLTGVLRPHGSTVPAAPPIRLPNHNRNPNPKTHPKNPIFNHNPNPKNKRK